MIEYEIKKMFSGKRNVALCIIAGLSIVYFTYIQSCSNSIGSSVPFDEYLGFNSYYGLLLFIISTLSLSYVFPYEEKNGMLQLLKVSYMRDKIVRSKFFLSFIITNILATLFFFTSIIGYVVAFDNDFNINLCGDALTYTVNPNITTQGDVLFVMLTTFVITINFNSILTVYFSIKTNNPFLVSILLPVVLTVLAAAAPLVKIPGLDLILALTPYSYIGHASTYKILFTVGESNVTAYMIGWGLYSIASIILYFQVKKAYRVC